MNTYINKMFGNNKYALNNFQLQYCRKRVNKKMSASKD